MKAIHNAKIAGVDYEDVVLYLKDNINFESDSQHDNPTLVCYAGCFVSQR